MSMCLGTNTYYTNVFVLVMILWGHRI